MTLLGHSTAETMAALAGYLSGRLRRPRPGATRLLATVIEPELSEVARRCAGLAEPSKRAARALVTTLERTLAPSALSHALHTARAELADLDRESFWATVEVLAEVRAPAPQLSRRLDRVGAVIADVLDLRAAATTLGRSLPDLSEAARIARDQRCSPSLVPPRASGTELRAIRLASMRADVTRVATDLVLDRGTHAQREVTVVLGSRVSDAGTGDLGLLAAPDTEALLDHRIATRSLWCRALKSRPRPPARPLVLLLDTSGSMRGAPEQVAKGLALAVCRGARGCGRAVRIVSFSGSSQRTELEAPANVLGFLAPSFHGATDYDAVLRRASEIRREPGFAESLVVLITDGQGNVTDDGTADGLVLVGGHQSPPLEALAGRAWRLASGSPDPRRH